MDKKIASQVLKTLDETANTIESLAKGGNLNPRQAAELIRNIDTFADKLEVAAYGAANLKARQAKVIQYDKDEAFMKTFDNTVKPIITDKDETYMHNAAGMDTFDADRSSVVTERDEYAVRDLSPHADKTAKQPSWARSPKAKSTNAG